MNLFKRFKTVKESNHLTVHEDSTINIAPYAPHQGLSAVPYKEPEVMMTLKKNFEPMIIDFLNKTSPDQYNASFVDAIVDRAKEQALRDIELQQADHQHTIERSIVSLWKGDREYYEKLLEEYSQEEDARKEELEKIKAIYYKGTAYEWKEA